MIIRRSSHNPILKPNPDNFWEAMATFNGCPTKKGKKICLLYRALSLHHYHALAQLETMVSTVGLADSNDGVHFTNHRRLVVPEHDWEKYGCEDPRVVKLNNKYFIFYTALSRHPFTAEGIKVAVAISRDLETIEEKHTVTTFNAKAMTLFPEKIDGKIWALLSVNTDLPPAKICLASFDREEDIWSPAYWTKWYPNFKKYSLPLERSNNDQVEVGAPPLKTKHGWLVIYSHIRNYFAGQPLFGVEAVLLDLNNPQKIIGRTETPLLTPEEYYERMGTIPNVVFPTGALVKGDWIYLYYGAADTTCALAYIQLSSLLKNLTGQDKLGGRLERAENNPLISPRKIYSWESKATFNPAAIYLDKKVHIVYRAMSDDNTSTLGYACSKDGFQIDGRLAEPIYVPREDFEQKLVPGGNSGCEDPRLVKMGSKIYMTYTAYDGQHMPRIALTSITARDFSRHQWNWAKPMLISPPGLDNKDACLFPVKVKGKYLIIHRYSDAIDYSLRTKLIFGDQVWLEENHWIYPRQGWWDSKKVGLAAPPLKTKAGWLMLYHGVSDGGIYRVGAVLLDLKNPLKILSRTVDPILEPFADYEKQGQVPGVVFPCGAVIVGKKLLVYYGGADQVVALASVPVAKIVKLLLAGRDSMKFNERELASRLSHGD